MDWRLKANAVETVLPTICKLTLFAKNIIAPIQKIMFKETSSWKNWGKIADVATYREIIFEILLLVSIGSCQSKNIIVSCTSWFDLDFILLDGQRSSLFHQRVLGLKKGHEIFLTTFSDVVSLFGLLSRL